MTGQNPTHAARLNQLETFVRVDMNGAAMGLVLTAIGAAVLGEPLLWLIAASLLVLVAALKLASGLVQSAPMRALGLVMVGNWITAVAVSIGLPFLWPIMVLTVVMTIVVAAPHLNGRELVAMLAVAALMAAVVALVGLGGDDGGAIPDLEDELEILIVVFALVALTIPIGLVVWQFSWLLGDALNRSLRLNDDLRDSQQALVASRRRIIAAADEARSNLERDLHDGAQQRLVALGMQIRAWQSTGHTVDPAELDAVRTELETALDDLRSLSHGLYPPALEAHGLVDALRSTARGHVHEVGEVGRFDRDVEAALYFVALEAIANALKHGGTPQVTVERQDDVLKMQVRDDGPGFDVDSVSHSAGLVHMADRIGALDGGFEVTSRPGETVVSVTVSRGA